MFDRFGVGAPSPFGVRGGVLAIGVHAAILAYGLRPSPRSVDPGKPVDTGVIFIEPPRRGLSVDVLPVPGPGWQVDLSGIHVTPPTVPMEPSAPGPIGMPTEPVGSAPTGDPNAVYDQRVVEQTPELLSSPPLRYPEALRTAHVEGVVEVQGVVDTLGHLEPKTLQVIGSPHPAFSASAIECLERAVFRPGRVEGRAVRVLVRIPVQFSIATRQDGF